MIILAHARGAHAPAIAIGSQRVVLLLLLCLFLAQVLDLLAPHLVLHARHMHRLFRLDHFGSEQCRDRLKLLLLQASFVPTLLTGLSADLGSRQLLPQLVRGVLCRKLSCGDSDFLLVEQMGCLNFSLQFMSKLVCCLPMGGVLVSVHSRLKEVRGSLCNRCGLLCCMLQPHLLRPCSQRSKLASQLCHICGLACFVRVLPIHSLLKRCAASLLYLQLSFQLPDPVP
mmetsp:Transcript_95537/g.227580  ORF Transcript_95537/g.227580 Transcript_95537/m.227580 type:complete len:227 (+) Transcript_95537:564-1244(+)